MTDITPDKLTPQLQEEELDFRSPVSESTLTRIGANTNFINQRQFDVHSWNLNGRYSAFGASAGPDGLMSVLFDMEIIGYLMFVGTAGTSGTTTVDIHKLSAGGTDDGTIFSTKPALATTAASGSYSMIRLDPASDLQLPTGHTKGLFSSTTFLEGEALRFDIDAGMEGSQNLHFQIMFRPI